MKIAIMGCGPGGSYLYCLLRQREPDVEIDLYDLPTWIQPESR
jgi:flavin-dependent dehydrogenase